MDPFKIFLVNKHKTVEGKTYKGTAFQKIGPPLTHYFSQVPVYVYIHRVLTTTQKAVSLPYKLLGSHTPTSDGTVYII